MLVFVKLVKVLSPSSFGTNWRAWLEGGAAAALDIGMSFSREVKMCLSYSHQYNAIQLRCKTSFFHMLIILGAFGSMWFYTKSPLLVTCKILEVQKRKTKELSSVDFLAAQVLLKYTYCGQRQQF